jgi:ribosomal protein S18 acetylase RimI-like enzyme
VGVLGVATRPEFRRRGLGEALTRRAIACAPEQPAVLQPSPDGYATYRKLGFAEIGAFTNWIFEPPES